MRYTAKLHAYRLGLMIKRENPCDWTCPKATQFYHSKRHKKYPKKYCDICKGFVGGRINTDDCPCTEFGKTEAIRRSYEALADWQVGSHPMSPEPRVARPQRPEGR